MGHHLHAFLFRGPVDRAAGAAWDDDLVFCPLPQDVLALGLPWELVERLEQRPHRDAPLPPGFLHLDGRAWQIAAAVAAGTRFVYLETDYFAGLGGQQAAAWQGGSLLTPAVVSINHALGLLGVVADGGADPFEGLGLDLLRDDDDLREGLQARVFAQHGRRLVGRYHDGAGGELELRAEPPGFGRWDGDRLHRWRWRPGGRFLDGEVAYTLDFERDGRVLLRSEPGGVVWRRV